MDRLRIIGAGWRRGGTEGLERFTVPATERAEVLPRLQEALGADEMIYLATCNRVELILTQTTDPERALPAPLLRRRAFVELTGRHPRAGEAEKALRLWGDEGALEHLLMVASGLDSAQLGEREILGQLRDSFRQAQELETSGPRLDWALTKAFRFARQVQRQTALSDGRHSLAGVGVERVMRHVAEHPGPVALVGVSPMTERCGTALIDAGVECLVVNRSAERGRDLARRLGCRFQILEAFRRRPEGCAAVVSAAGAREPLLGRSELQALRTASARPILLVDFGVPPNIEPEASRELGLSRLDMEAISEAADASRSRRQGEAASARECLDRALGELATELAERETSPVVAEIARRYRETARDGADRLFRRQLRHLGESDRHLVEAFALNLAKRLAHLPILGLRALASEHGHAAAETFLAASDEELARLLSTDRLDSPGTGEAA